MQQSQFTEVIHRWCPYIICSHVFLPPSKSLIFLLFLLFSWEGWTEWDWVPMWGISFNPCLLSTDQHTSREFIPIEPGSRSPPTRLWPLSPVPQGCCVSPIPHQSLPESCWKSNFLWIFLFFFRVWLKWFGTADVLRSVWEAVQVWCSRVNLEQFIVFWLCKEVIFQLIGSSGSMNYF